MLVLVLDEVVRDALDEEPALLFREDLNVVKRLVDVLDDDDALGGSEDVPKEHLGEVAGEGSHADLRPAVLAAVGIRFVVHDPNLPSGCDGSGEPNPWYYWDLDVTCA